MRWWVTALGGLLLVAGFVVVLSLDAPQPRQHRTVDGPGPEVLVSARPADLVGLTVRLGAGRVGSARRHESEWRRQDGTPLAGPEFDYLLERLAPLLSARTLPGAAREPYGLAQPATVFGVEAAGRPPVTVMVGDRDLEGRLRYVAVAGRDAVDLISAQLVDDLLALVAPPPPG